MTEMLEQDLEQLEQYLDGALDATTTSQLQARLTTDANLASALAELESQRSARASLWQMIDPDPATADRLMWRIKGAMLNQERSVATKSRFSWSPWRIANVSSAAAACVILGFMFGRAGHHSPTQPAPVGDTHSSVEPIVQNNPVTPLTYALPSISKPKISVPVTNEYGQVVAWQTFDNPEDAKSFTEDLHKARSTPVPAQPKLVGQEQF